MAQHNYLSKTENRKMISRTVCFRTHFLKVEQANEVNYEVSEATDRPETHVIVRKNWSSEFCLMCGRKKQTS